MRMEKQNNQLNKKKNSSQEISEVLTHDVEKKENLK